MEVFASCLIFLAKAISESCPTTGVQRMQRVWEKIDGGVWALIFLDKQRLSLTKYKNVPRGSTCDSLPRLYSFQCEFLN